MFSPRKSASSCMKRIVFQNLLDFLVASRKCIVVTSGKDKDKDAIASEFTWRNWCCANVECFGGKRIPLGKVEDRDRNVMSLLQIRPKWLLKRNLLASFNHFTCVGVHADPPLFTAERCAVGDLCAVSTLRN